MQLPSFITRALAFFTKAEGQLEKIVEANNLISSLQSEAKTAKETIATRDASILELQGKLEAANTLITAKDGEITELKGKVQTETTKANTVIANQGLSPADLPAQAPGKAAGGSEETAWQKYNRLQAGDAREAGRFYAENAEKIMASRPK